MVSGLVHVIKGGTKEIEGTKRSLPSLDNQVKPIQGRSKDPCRRLQPFAHYASGDYGNALHSLSVFFKSEWLLITSRKNT